MESLRHPSVPSGRDVLLHALESFSKEDFSARLPLYLDGVDEEVVVAFNAAAAANERFSAQARRIEERMRQVERERGELERARAALAEQATQLALDMRHKSEFLANMSDELRTPLSSMLILAKLLADNDGDNLTAKQVDYAQTIYAAGTELLSLVDDILDLASIESDRIALDIGDERFQDLRDYFRRAFRQAARDRHVAFDVALAADLPAAMRTDGRRLRQILKNLLSIVFKVARGGSVRLRIAPLASPAAAGLPPGQQGIAFEVYHQADGSIGGECGTLGLAICRELTRSLGGELRVASTLGEGIRFVLQLPLVHAAAADETPPRPAATPAPGGETQRGGEVQRGARPALPGVEPQPAYHGRKSRCADEAVMLIAEGNAQVAAVMLDLVRANGYQGVIATDLGTMRLLLRELAPDAILLGGSLMDVDGWTMLELLKRDPETRRIPVSMTYFDARSYLCLQIDAATEFGHGMVVGLDAAAGRSVKRLLAADAAGFARGDESWRVDGRETVVVADGAQALDAMRRDSFDALVTGPQLGDMSVIELLRAIGAAGQSVADLPVAMIEAPGESVEIAVLRRRHKLEDVLEETALYLHRSVGNLPPGGRETAPRRRAASPELAGRKVLIVDDDIYNIYAMTGALEQQGMIVVVAENGREGIDALRGNPDTDIVLMDITMPEPDGDDTIRSMRGLAEFESLPIIAVTARAMPGDREKCIGAGASDYISKPVNVEQLLALLRTWLARAR
ncbi:MAG: response regulator [Rhodocyclaceae bacterium]|nr:response regulator [Rhodocyclaceae bacterium]